MLQEILQEISFNIVLIEEVEVLIMEVVFMVEAVVLMVIEVLFSFDMTYTIENRLWMTCIHNCYIS